MTKKREYATIQVDKDIKNQIIQYCDMKGLKIGRYIENLFSNHISGSVDPVIYISSYLSFTFNKHH